MDQSVMLIISDNEELIYTLKHIQPKGVEVLAWKFKKLKHEIIDDNKFWIEGSILKKDFYLPWKDIEEMLIVLSIQDINSCSKIREMISEHLPQAKILSLKLGLDDVIKNRELDSNSELALSWRELLVRPIKAEIRHVKATKHIQHIRFFLDKEKDSNKIALLLQPDPDPDGLASALALRTIIGRNKISTPIVSFGSVTRPENIAMMKLLDIEVTTIEAADLENFDNVVLLDTQPGHFKENIKADIVIDHHPIKEKYENIKYMDIRPNYGATSTILYEYLQSAAIPVPQRLATALLYGIKSDTLHLNREVIDADLDAFVSLYPKINYNLLRKIEKPELPMSFADVISKSLKKIVCSDNIILSHLGTIEREDLVPQMADFVMQFEDIQWGLASGIFEKKIIISVRNVGYVKSAGDIIKKITVELGEGGGHRTMGKFVCSVNIWKKKIGPIKNIQNDIFNLFKKVINDKS